MPSVTLTMPSSGALSFSDLRNVFGQVNLAALYRGGANVANISANNNVPTSGTISLSNFYSAQGSVFVNDQYGSEQEINDTSPGQVITSTWSPLIVSRSWRVRWNYTRNATPSGIATNTWIDRSANQAASFSLTTANNPSTGGSVIHTGNVTIDYALPGSTTPFFTDTVHYIHRIIPGL